MTGNYDLQYEAEVIKYFDDKAEAYDLVEEQIYWRLSDKLLWTVLSEEVLSKLPENFLFMDAGGGTGRWTMKILQAYPKARAMIYDLSLRMTEQARASAERLNVSDRLDVRNGRLEDVEQAVSPGFDLIFNFHNVLGFVQDPTSVLSQLNRLLNNQGVLVSFVPNSYHAAFFNILLGKIDEAEGALVTRRSRFTSNMPDMQFFTPRSVAELYRESGFTVERITGFPNLIYPGYQETQLRGSTMALQNVLGTQENFDAIYAMEYGAQKDEMIVGRSNNIFVVGRKRMGSGPN